MREAILFYSFMVIFIVTAIVTLLGVVGRIAIPETQLNMLLGAFLVELAGAVVALYRRTNFFSTSSHTLAMSLGSAFEAFDKISDEIEAAIKDQQVDSSHAHGFLIQRMGDSVVAYQKMRLITGEELAQLPVDQRNLIRDYEKSMKDLLKEWRKIKHGGTTQLDPEIRKKKLNLLRTMKDDLVGVLDFLQKQGVYLDDHYIEVRHLVSNL